MAISDEIRHQRSKLKGKGLKAYISYFLTYYTWTTVAVIVCAVMAISIITTVLNKKADALEVIMLNASTMAAGDTDYGTDLASSYMEYAGIDAGHNSVTVDTTSYMTPGFVMDTYDISASQKVSVQAAAGTLDCLVADAANYYRYAYSLAFSDLREVLPEETLAQYEDHLYYVDWADVEAYQAQIEETNNSDVFESTEEAESYELVSSFVMPDPAAMENPVPIGIVVTDAPQIADSGIYTDRVAILGFIGNAPHAENAISFLAYLWQ